MTYHSDELRKSLHVIRQCCGNTYGATALEVVDEVDRLTLLVATRDDEIKRISALVAAKAPTAEYRAGVPLGTTDAAPTGPRKPWMDTLYGGEDDGSPVKRDRDLAAYCDALAAKVAALGDPDSVRAVKDLKARVAIERVVSPGRAGDEDLMAWLREQSAAKPSALYRRARTRRPSP